MTDREMSILIEKHDRYQQTGKTFPYQDHLKLFDALVSRWKYQEAKRQMKPDKIQIEIFES